MVKQTPQYLRVAFSPGINPDKWFGRFDSRVEGWRIAGAANDDPLPYIDKGAADIGIVRLGNNEIPAKYTPDNFHIVELYTEQLGVAAPKDHPIEVMKQVKLSELGDEIEMYRTPPSGIVNIPALREALGVVAANVGIAIAPRPLLRALRSRGIVHRDVSVDRASDFSFSDASPSTPAAIGKTTIALVWLKERDADEVQDFVGICRGRKAGSSRASSPKKSPRHTTKPGAQRRAQRKTKR